MNSAAPAEVWRKSASLVEGEQERDSAHEMITDECAAEFLDHACQGEHRGQAWRSKRAQELLQEKPGLTQHSLHCAAACADLATLQAMLIQDRAAVEQLGGPRSWPPLLYLCNSRLGDHSGDALAAARLLLEAGADANAHFMAQGLC
jgi:hypothetical protein